MTPSADAQGTCSLDSPASATRLLQEVEDMRGWSLGTGAACRAVGLEVGGVLSGLLRKRRGYNTTSYFSFQSALVEPLASYASMEVVVGNCEPKNWGFRKERRKVSVLLFRLCGLWRRGSHRRPCRKSCGFPHVGQEAGAPSAAIWPMVPAASLRRPCVWRHAQHRLVNSWENFWCELRMAASRVVTLCLDHVPHWGVKPQEKSKKHLRVDDRFTSLRPAQPFSLLTCKVKTQSDRSTYSIFCASSAKWSQQRSWTLH